MTHRERLLGALRFEPVDRVPDIEFGAWIQTVDRWIGEGFPEKYKDTGMWFSIPDYFKTEDNIFRNESLGLKTTMHPGFETKVLEEKGDHIIFFNEEGVLCEMVRPELGASIPKYLRFPIESRQDWIKFRDERLNPDDPARVPEDIEERCKQSLTSDLPVAVEACGLYGLIRNWMGVENLSYAIYDDPDWVVEMMEHLTLLMESVYQRVAGKCKIDIAFWWEDMCFNHGPLISPELFTKWMVPRYKRITDLLLNECGCEFNMVDCDGKIDRLVPFWVQCGINVMFPVEIAHTDIYWLRKHFPQMPLVGGFDKRALAGGKDAIDAEFERLRPLFDSGGFIPHTDHLVPPDVSFDDYCYYREKKMNYIGRKG